MGDLFQDYVGVGERQVAVERGRDDAHEPLVKGTCADDADNADNAMRVTVCITRTH